MHIVTYILLFAVICTNTGIRFYGCYTYKFGVDRIFLYFNYTILYCGYWTGTRYNNRTGLYDGSLYVLLYDCIVRFTAAQPIQTLSRWLTSRDVWMLGMIVICDASVSITPSYRDAINNHTTHCIEQTVYHLPIINNTNTCIQCTSKLYVPDIDIVRFCIGR